MINCKSCCYCGQGKNIKCPFYGQSGMHTESIKAIEKDANKSQTVGLYWAACLLYGHGTQKNERKAVAILEKLARKDYVPAQYLLSLCYFDGIKVRQNPEKAFELCQAAARDGCNLAEIKLYHCYRDGVGVKQDPEQAKDWCGYAAGHQSSEVYYEYAEMCSSRKYGKTDMKEACIFLKRAAENGDKVAYDRLVELHKKHLEECYEGFLDPTGIFAHQQHIELGDFCLKNPYAPNVRKALANYRLAKEVLLDKQKKNAEDLQSENIAIKHYARNGVWSNLKPNIAKCQERIQECYALILAEVPARKTLYECAIAGDSNAQFDLACLFGDKKSELYDPVESVGWHQLSAEQGNAAAQSSLGYCYFMGEGVEKNYAEAVKWYRLSAERGNADAQHGLGCCYHGGYGVKKNLAEAVKWYRLSAEQGNATAQSSLGYCYYGGEGVEKNYAEAVKWYRLSANQGNAGAQYNVGLCYYCGNGVGKDMDRAKEWFSLAAEQGHNGAKDMLAKMERARAYADAYSGPVNGYDQPRKLEPTIWYDWRTGERLLRNEDGEVVNGKGETVSAAWWD